MAYTINLEHIDRNSDGIDSETVNLGELLKSGLPVPPGFVITKEAHRSFLQKNGLESRIEEVLDTLNINDKQQLAEKSRGLETLIMESSIPEDLEKYIRESYDELSVGKEAVDIGTKALDMIKSGRDNIPVVLRSSASEKSFTNISGIQSLLDFIKKCWASAYSTDMIGKSADVEIVVQRMVGAEKSGFILTEDPVNGTPDRIVLEAVWGLSESVSSGLVTPDNYLLDKNTGEPMEKKISKKLILLRKDYAGRTVRERVPNDKMESQVLSESEINALWDVARRAEALYDNPQDIEWCLERNKLFLLKIKPITESRKESKSKEMAPTPEPIAQQIIPEPAERIPEQDLITATEIKVNLFLPEEAEKIVGIVDGVGLLKAEHILTRRGKHPIYLAKTNPEELMQDIIDNIGKIAKVFYPKPVWYRSLDTRTDEFSDLEGSEEEPREANPLLGWHGIRRSLDEQDILKCELAAIKVLHDKGLNNVHMMLPFVIDSDELRRVKELLDFPLRLGIMVETPASALSMENFCQEGIDFASININSLTQLALGVDRGNPEISSLYSETHPGVLELIKRAVSACKKHGVTTSVSDGGADPNLIEKLISIGIDSISSDSGDVQRLRSLVAKIERRLLLETLRK